MRAPLAAAAAAVALSLGACLPAPQRLRERTDPRQGAILMAVSFKGREMPYWRRHLAQELFFSRVGSDNTLDPVLVPANYRVGDRLYALDVPPGRYALVAASYFTGRARQLARFEPSISTKNLVVEVKPGEIAFAGVAQIERDSGEASEVLMNGVRRALQYLPPFKRAVIEVKRVGPPRLRRDADAEVEALRLARADLAGTFWAEAVAQRLLALGNPAPELMEGVVHRRAVPRHDAKAFTFVDTLEWGQPRPVPGGLEWSLPKGRAAVSVVFLPSAGAGSRTLASVLRELREVGAPEDTHTLVEIFVSSRPAYAGRFTTYVYPEPALLGSSVTVLKTETLVIPAADGLYKVQYRAESSEFEKHRPQFERFVRYVDFAPPRKDRT